MDENRLSHFRGLLENQLSEIDRSAREHEDQLASNHDTGDFVGGDRAAELESLVVDQIYRSFIYNFRRISALYSGN